MPIPQLPRGERRLANAAFLTLFGILAAQTLLETARDTLFLTRLSVARLPWLYLGMAALTLTVARTSAARGRHHRGSDMSRSLLIGTAFTALLWPALGGAAVAPVYVLFLWTGVFSAWMVTQVWTLLAESLDVSQAKRLYGRLAAGGGLGAVTGAATARLASGVVEPRSLLLLAALATAATALGPALVLGGETSQPDSKDDNQADRRNRAPSPPRAPRPGSTTQPYLGRLLVLTALVAAVSTLIDFSFKEAVAARLLPAQLPAFFATFHLAGTTLSLAIQLFGVSLVLRLVGVGRAQLIFPVLLAVAAAGAMVSGGFVAFVLLRGLDASLRNSFQRPSFELLQMPLSDGLRRRAKPIIDVLGQRGGQVVAAVGLLVMLQLPISPQQRLFAVAGLLLVWIVIAAGLNQAYVDRLRQALLGTGAAPAGDPLDQTQAGEGVDLLTSGQHRQLEGALNHLVGHDQHLAGLVQLLGRRETRGVARPALIATGAPAFDALARALADAAQPRAVRANAIRPLVQIDRPRAARALLEQLPVERDSFVRYHLLQALAQLQRERPDLPLDDAILARAATAMGESARRYLLWRLALDEGAARHPSRRTQTFEMLRVLLREHEQNALERLSEVLALRYPGENLRKLLEFLRKGARRTRATARELAVNVLDASARALMQALVAPTDQERLTALAGQQIANLPSYGAVLRSIRQEEPGTLLAQLAETHATELAVHRLRPAST